MKKCLLFTLLSSGMLHTFSSRAQIVSGNAYLQNSYLQTSVSGNGRLYTGATPPAGYQSSYYGGLGFIVDLDKDGWTIGNPPYYGDWFRCGSPVEEWYLQVGNVVYHPDGSDSTILPSKVKGNVYYYKATTTNVTAKWQASLGHIELQQDYTVPSDSLMIKILVRIKNTGATTLKDVYYQRVTEMDFPDPRFSIMGKECLSHNRIKQQPYSGKGLAWVQESADTGYRGQMNMVTNDCRAKAFILDAGLTPLTSPDTIYQGIAAASRYYYTPGDYVYYDLGMGLVFKVDSLRPGETTSLSMIYRVDSTGLSGGLGSAYKSSWNIGGLSYKSKDTVHACPGSALSVSIDFPGSSDWIWDASPALAFTTGTANTIAVGKDTLSYRAVRRASGCTDADTLLLTVAPFVVEKPVIVRTGDRLTTTKAYKFYQWMRNGIDIPGATAYYYDITMTGCYSVNVMDDHNCESTSDTICDGLSVAGIGMMGTPVVYPNPVEHTVRIEAAVPLNAQIADITGRILLTMNSATEIDMHLFNKGVYLLYLYTQDNKERKVYKLLKQ